MSSVLLFAGATMTTCSCLVVDPHQKNCQLGRLPLLKCGGFVCAHSAAWPVACCEPDLTGSTLLHQSQSLLPSMSLMPLSTAQLTTVEAQSFAFHLHFGSSQCGADCFMPLMTVCILLKAVLTACRQGGGSSAADVPQLLGGATQSEAATQAGSDTDEGTDAEDTMSESGRSERSNPGDWQPANRRMSRLSRQGAPVIALLPDLLMKPLFIVSRVEVCPSGAIFLVVVCMTAIVEQIPE